MKFVGKPRDYYDHQVYVWGEDPKIVYDRNAFWPADPPIWEGGQPVLRSREFKVDGEMHFRFNYDGEERGFERFLAVCGRIYPLVYADAQGVIYPEGYYWSAMTSRPEQTWQIYRPDFHRKAKDSRPRPIFSSKGFWSWMEGIQDVKAGDALPAIENLSRQVHQPIFVISKMEARGRNQGYQHTKFTVEPEYPVTSDMGLGQFESADKLYQDVGYWLSNIINPSPDVLPEAKPPQTDVEKAVAHGFDKKVSFRKRRD